MTGLTGRSGLVAILALTLGLGYAPQAAAQVRIGPEIGGVRFWGASRPLNPGTPTVFPYRHTSLGVRLAVGGAGPRVGLGFRYAEQSLAAEGPALGKEEGGAVLVYGAMSTLGIRPALSLPVLTLTSTVTVRVESAIMIEIWSLYGEDNPRLRVGPSGAVGLEADLGRGFSLTLMGEVAATASPFEANELPEGLGVRTAWRRALYGGVLLRL